MAWRDRLLPASGSSPLARGTRHRIGRRLHPERFISARAGNTPRTAASTAARPVHPRSRGEHAGGVRRYGLHRGSSPLARGTPHPPRPHLPHQRFIPARAGNTNHCSLRSVPSSVHPRSRGEHATAQDTPMRRLGSSPLARGTRGAEQAVGQHRRFIPARAGNTDWLRAGRRAVSVHPRSRGEHSLRCCAPVPWSGSSPLARGTRSVSADSSPRDRFIPARAGNTRPRATS